MRQPLRGGLAALTLTVAVAAGGANAEAAPAGADLMVSIGVSNTLTRNFPGVPNGGTGTVTRLDFIGGFFVDLINLEAGSSTVRFELGPGLRWGAAESNDPSEKCSKTVSARECLVPKLVPQQGANGIGWGWDIIAEKEGSYSLSATIIEAETPDPDLSNNSAKVTVIVAPSTGGGGSGGGSGGGTGGSGGSASTSASSAKLTPARPKAGSLVSATVRVTSGGAPVRPTGVACAASAGGAKVRGTGKAASGSATCSYRPPKSAKGKVLSGSVSFTASGKRFTRRFSARLG